jgi:hypothetical protein
MRYVIAAIVCFLILFILAHILMGLNLGNNALGFPIGAIVVGTIITFVWRLIIHSKQ